MRLINCKHLLRAGRHSLAGLGHAWKQQAFRHEVLLLPVLLLVLVLVRPGTGWTAAALIGWLIVMAFELLNSAIEEVFDLVSPFYSDAVKYGKDMASATILLALAANVVLWGCMLWTVL